MLYQPDETTKILIAGDANRASLTQMLKDYPELMEGVSKFKVPHHGSKHNLTTEIIDSLAPRSSVISAKGSMKHPSSAIVYWLSRHCNVYSTHKSNSLIYGSNINGNATPLKAKIKA